MNSIIMPLIWYCCSCGDGPLGSITMQQCQEGCCLYRSGSVERSFGTNVAYMSASTCSLLVGVAAGLEAGRYPFAPSSWLCDRISIDPVEILDSATAMSTTGLSPARNSCGNYPIPAVIAFATATTCFYHTTMNNSATDRVRFRDHTLLAGMVCGIGIGVCTGRDARATILEVMPWAILSALVLGSVLSTLWHKKLFRVGNQHWDSDCSNYSDKCDSAL
ncbi:hypothetical protein BDV95DRAFT_557715 [Massariosphaeria phaeospora]|uniref:Uncharacterized protein n=1 Tax=Massariosphaeria phaeospora TaxID=100035 RepID=A0A7C8MJV8_9PLEO|nr:hypothetical protein BDV95DRAFT_557715 [Massariosphaeria phaeospora]